MLLFKKCSTMDDIKKIHPLIIKSGADKKTLFVIGKIIVFCAVSDYGDMDYAVPVFENIENPDGFLWNTMIRGFGKSSQFTKAFDYYKRMRENSFSPDNFTFSFLLKDIKTASRLFEELPQPELVAWNTIIDCHVYGGKCKAALDLFLRMLRSGIEPDEATLLGTLSACSALGALDFGRWLHSCVTDTSLGNLTSVSNALVDMYAKCGAVEEAYKAFDKMKRKNIVSWNTMILGLATHGHANKALTLFSKMLRGNLERPDDVTFLGVLCACSHGGMVDEGRKYFGIMYKDYLIKPTIKHYGCMVDILGRAGLVEEAYLLIRSMPIECNAIVWRTLLGACWVHGNMELGERGKWNEVTSVRKSMQDHCVRKPEPVIASLAFLPARG
ncbi:hypothetical protein JRO89_XS13G0246900 [Xanthoceras sorbifolium]|uniref:Pentatricopeptide repeat-containing protein n=1 Tax=Xanthoceras sorbifolium TaxID=99658 RepID=A0ABQ8H9T1_9ROSI|nr:hypothetical protein JRO89_XS13G0246900 [Xanthoceras sorbifolium]